MTHFIQDWLRLRLRPTFGSRMVIGVPYSWLLVLFLIPFFIVLKISFAEQEIAIPPYSPLWSYDADMARATVHLSFVNYQDIFVNFWQTLKGEFNPFNLLVKITGSGSLKETFASWGVLSETGNNIYLKTYISSFFIAIVTTLLCLLFGYPIAYAIARMNPKYRNGVLLAIMLPFWTSFLLRVYAWMGLLSTNGIINNFLARFGIAPLDMYYNTFSLLLVMVYAYLPFMVLPLYTQLIKLDSRLLEASADLGAGPIKSFWTITWPLSRAGIIAGSMLVFIPAVGEFVIPELVGGPENLMIGKVLWNAFFDQNNWPQASAIAVIMVILLVIPIALFHRYETRELEGEAS
ncbi:MAG: ABC transporter permease subunit [Neisseria sp.]|nr:ABC transporter permease subunit [Neisseria sp.]